MSLTKRMVANLNGMSTVKFLNCRPRCLSTAKYAPEQLGPFTQQAPRLGNPYTQDVTLQRYLQRTIDQSQLPVIHKDLCAFGNRIRDEIDALGRKCELHPPYLQQYDAWGQRVNFVTPPVLPTQQMLVQVYRLHTCAAWQQQKRIAADEGLVSIGYKRTELGAAARLYQYAKLYLYSSSSGLYSCPLAMTDGAAKTIQVVKPDEICFMRPYRGLAYLRRPSNSEELPGARALTADAFDRLTSSDAYRLWTSGQWMTERGGGSDVACWLPGRPAGTDTEAVRRPDGGGGYRLHGLKWFSSATDADVALTLAREPGCEGLSLFFVKVRDEATGALNGMQIVRLKDKLGTRQLPTAELLLHGTEAIRLSEPGRGVASIAHMLNITRLHNAIAACSAMRRITNLAVDYAHRRRAFGRAIIDWPLHARTLARLEAHTRAATLLTFRVVHLLGRQEHGQASEAESSLLRVMTPVVKLYTAKLAMKVVSEGLEAFGGLGYLEDSGLPAVLRDAQVLPIWEGTTNVLSLDVCRVLSKQPGAVLDALQHDTARLTGTALADASHPLHARARAVATVCRETLPLYARHPDVMTVAARDFAHTFANVYSVALLINQACHEDASASEVFVARTWCGQLNRLQPLAHYTGSRKCSDRQLLGEGRQQTSDDIDALKC